MTAIEISILKLFNKNYSPQPVNLDSYKWQGRRRLSKSYEKKRIIPAPYSIFKLLKLIDKDEHHSGCINSKVNTSLLLKEAIDNKVHFKHCFIHKLYIKKICQESLWMFNIIKYFKGNSWDW